MTQLMTGKLAQELANIITEKHKAETILIAVATYSHPLNRKAFDRESEILDYIYALCYDYDPENFRPPPRN